MIETHTVEQNPSMPTPNGFEPVAPAPRRLRARPVSVTFTVEIVADDGDALHPVETRAMRLPALDWQSWQLDVVVAQVQAQLDQQ